MSKKEDTPPVVELPTDTYILSLNKKFAKIETNANNQLLYTLKNPIKLNTGDQVSLYKSYLNIRGLNSNTMTIDEDFDVDIKTGLFIPASIKRYADTGNDFYEFNTWSEYYQVPDPETLRLKVTETGGKIDVDFSETGVGVVDGKYSFKTQGDYNSPYIGVKIETVGSDKIYKSVTQTANFKIDAGQYDVNALALEITNQLNGSQLTDNQNQNIVFDGTDSRDFNEIFSRGGTFTKQFQPSSFTTDIFDAIGIGGSTDFDPLFKTRYGIVKPLFGKNMITGSAERGEGIAFLDLFKARQITDEVKAYVLGDRSKTATQILLVDRDVTDRTDCSKDAVQKSDNLLVPKEITSRAEQILGADTTVNPDISITSEYIKANTGGATLYTVEPADDSIEEVGWFHSFFKRTGGGAPDQNVNIIGWVQLVQQFFLDEAKKTTPTPFDGEKIPVPIMPQISDETARTYGTRTFNLVFNNENRFSFSNTCEPFRIPSITGETGGDSTPGSALGNQAAKFPTDSNTKYPQESTSGNFITSFDNGLIKQTQRYKDLITQQALHENTTAEYWVYQWALDYLPHDFYYDSDKEGEDAWENSLWSRLGFSYDDLGKITDKEIGYTTPFNTSTNTKMLGFITHNSYGSSLQIGLSGLGDAILQGNSGSTTIETFDEVGIFNNPKPFPTIPTFSLKNVSDYTQKLIPELFDRNYNYIYILSTSQFFNASTLPDLSGGKNYFLIESDLIPSNYLDESNSQRAIIGFVDKEFSSNDTIFSSTAIPFSIKQNKIVNTVMINILNADGTKPIDTVLGDSSSFLLMVQRNANAIFNYLEDEEIELVAEEGTRPTTQAQTQ